MIDADLPRSQHGHVILGDGAPVLLYQIGTHETRALVDVPDNLPSASVGCGGVKAHLRQVVLPSLPTCVRPSFEMALDKGLLRSMPNSFLPPTTNKTAGLVLLGDAMNMRHPLTGGGMTVAFNDVVLLSTLLHPRVVPRLNDTATVIKQMTAFHWRRKRLTSVINILAQALYALFAANGKVKPLLLSFFSIQVQIQHEAVSTDNNDGSRFPTSSPSTGLFPIFSNGRSMRRWSRRSFGRYHPSTGRFVLSFLCRRSLFRLSLVYFYFDFDFVRIGVGIGTGISIDIRITISLDIHIRSSTGGEEDSSHMDIIDRISPRLQSRSRSREEDDQDGDNGPRRNDDDLSYQDHPKLRRLLESLSRHLSFYLF